MFTARFELRVPPFADVTHAQLHREYLDMVSWCDDNGIATVIVSEHHGAEDGFMASPLILAGAALARTDNITVAVSALLLPFHDPIRIAEDIATIDLIAPGRLSVTMGVAYREFEFDMFGKDRTRRGRDTEEAIKLILRCWTGEPFEHEGRTIWVTPKPVTEPHPAAHGGRVGAGLSSTGGPPRAALLPVHPRPVAGRPLLRRGRPAGLRDPVRHRARRPVHGHGHRGP